MSDIALRNVAPPKEDDILSVDIYSDGKARCYSWSDKWIDAEVIDSKPMTNADRIRTMTDEELADGFASRCCPVKDEFYNCGEINKKEFSWEDCKSCWLDWLKQEVDNG